MFPFSTVLCVFICFLTIHEFITQTLYIACIRLVRTVLLAFSLDQFVSFVATNFDK